MVCGKAMPRSATWGPEWLVRTFCSEDCSESRLAPLDYRLQEAVLQLLGRQSEGESVEPGRRGPLRRPVGLGVLDGADAECRPSPRGARRADDRRIRNG